MENILRERDWEEENGTSETAHPSEAGPARNTNDPRAMGPRAPPGNWEAAPNSTS